MCCVAASMVCRWPHRHAHSSDIVLIRSAEAPSPEQDAMKLASQFYGLDLKTIVVREKARPRSRNVEQKSTLAVVVEANALGVIDRNTLLKALRRSTGNAVPLLILGVTPETDSALLSGWSRLCRTWRRNVWKAATRLDYGVGWVAGLTQQLSGIRIPFPGRDTFYLR